MARKVGRHPLYRPILQTWLGRHLESSPHGRKWHVLIAGTSGAPIMHCPHCPADLLPPNIRGCGSMGHGHKAGALATCVLVLLGNLWQGPEGVRARPQASPRLPTHPTSHPSASCMPRAVRSTLHVMLLCMPSGTCSIHVPLPAHSASGCLLLPHAEPYLAAQCGGPPYSHYPLLHHPHRGGLCHALLWILLGAGECLASGRRGLILDVSLAGRPGVCVCMCV